MHWTLQRNDTQEMLKLHAQFDWVDEYDWQALAQSEPVYTLTGAMDIQQGIKKAGRPITLSGTRAVIKRRDVQTLQSWANVPELIMTLTHPKGQSYSVIFRRPAINNIVVWGKSYQAKDCTDDDWMTCDVNLLTV